MAGGPLQYYDWQPLADFYGPVQPATHAWGPGAMDARQTALAELLGISRHTVNRWASAGRLPWYQADRVATAIGTHPSVIWPDWFPLEQAS